MKMFCATVRCGIRLSSWWIMLMPRSCAAGVGDLDFPPLVDDAPGVLVIDAGEDLHQRRLAGAVLADQGVDFAGAQLEPALAERVDAGKLFSMPSIETRTSPMLSPWASKTSRLRLRRAHLL